MKNRSGNQTNDKCLLCYEEMSVEHKNVFDTRYGFDGKYNIQRCLSCDIQQIAPVPTHHEIKELYETHYNFGGEKGTAYTILRERFFASFLYRLWLAVDSDISFHNFKGSGRLLDVGCNEGRGLRLYRQNGFDAEGLEINERAAMEARKGGFGVYTDCIEDFEPKESYGVAVLANVLEHSLQPKAMLEHIGRILKSKGQIWIGCPNVDSWQRLLFGKYWINWHVPFHIVHFTRDTLMRLLRESGFEITQARQVSPSLWMAHSIIARIFAKPGQPTKQLRNPFLVAFLTVLIRILLFPVLWLGNRLGRGDCLVVVARKVFDPCAS